VTVAETAKAPNLASPDFVYRLIRAGGLHARKVGGTWHIDAESVEERKRRVALKRSSGSNLAAERERRMAEAEALFRRAVPWRRTIRSRRWR
jgi:excisionase family DNA binding protein